MATDKRPQYAVTIEKDLKDRLVRLPVNEHRALADPMRKHLEALVSKAESRTKKNGKE